MQKFRRFVELIRKEGALSAARHTINFISPIWDKRKRALRNWEEKHRYEYNISDNDVVFDIGGFEGDFSENLLQKHSPGKIHIFEPVPEFVDIISNKFSDKKNVDVHGYGLQDENEIVRFGLDGNSSSVYTGNKETKVMMKDVVEVIEEMNIDEIKLMKINIEGGEYDLLDRLLHSEYINDIENIQVQFHNFSRVKNAERRRKNIRSELRKTHKLTFDYYFVWENWKRI